MPLAVWASTLETSNEVKQAIISDVELSHANPVVQEIIFVFCDTIRFLLWNHNDEDRAQEAFSHAQELAEKDEYAGTKSKFKDFNCYDLLELAQNLSFNADYGLNDIFFLNTNYSCLAGQQGAPNHPSSIKHAFVLAFYFLLRSIKHHDLNLYYEKVLSETVKLGGDTDANACVVGALIGAFVGVRRLPLDMLSNLLSFEDSLNGQSREGAFLVREPMLQKIDQLIQVRPKE